MRPLGSPIMVEGFVTQRKFCAGRSLRDLEVLAGFARGRLAQGAAFATLSRLPGLTEFELVGPAASGTESFALRRMAWQGWSREGPEALVKILPTVRHDPMVTPEDQDAARAAVPLWRLTVPIAGTIVGFVARYDLVVGDEALAGSRPA